MNRPCAVRMFDRAHGAGGNFDVFCDCGWSTSIATLDPWCAMRSAADHLAATVRPSIDELADLLAAVR